MPIASFPVTRLVALVGGSGFLGTAVAELFAAAGWRVVALCRTPENARHLKPLGDLGQVGARYADVRRPETLAPALRGADVVVNLVGILDQRGGQTFAAIHEDGARAVAEAALAVGAPALVQISALGARPTAGSAYLRSKAAGEEAVLAVRPDAAILRPATLFGAGDRFTNRFASLVAAAPVVPVVAPDTRLQPAYVYDVAEAVFRAAGRLLLGGKVGRHDLAGPDILTIRRVVAFVAESIGRDQPRLDTPRLGARLLAGFGFLPGAPLTRDQLALIEEDSVADGSLPGLAEFGITPVSLFAVARQWLDRYQAGGRFAAG